MKVLSMTSRMPTLVGILLCLGGGVLLEYVVRMGYVSQFVIPTPSSVLQAIPGLFVEEDALTLLLITVRITFAATAMAILIGLPTGWLLWRFPLFGRAYEDWLAALFSAPIILLYPVFLVLFGRGEVTIIVMSFVVGVLPITLSTYSGLKNVPEVYINVARSFNMPEGKLFRKVLLPASLSSIFTGLRLSMIYTMINAVAIEYLINIGGLGFLVGNLNDRFDIPGMYAAVIFVVLVSALFFMLIDRSEKWLSRK